MGGRGKTMDRNRRATFKVAVPALSLLLVSGFLLAGGPQQQKGIRGLADEGREFTVITTDADETPAPLRNITDLDCTFQQDPLRYLETEETRDAKRTSQITSTIRWGLSLDGTTTGTTTANSI